ncbi:type II CAAX endopeptidase family protein [Fusibacter sp. 3D3]|uniref:type II CAAX endopeptidase family protein n=1 Tax=Fusibacter sp. 3D3 TaxID=1048380 RepID=UPI0008536CAF|nr:type II CAAX endopeptidase family protein [Fusibacter sp. 3D3]GAU77157.1 possible homolog of CAAX-like membrane endopeptidase [Fusibacter sp. 3D3]
MENQNLRSRHYNILEANVIFFILAGVFLTVGAYVQSKDVLSGLLITEYGIVLAPILLYTLITKKDFKAIFRLKKVPFKQALKIMGIAILLLPTIAVVNLITILIIEIFSDAIVFNIPTAETGVQYLGLMFIISITAGICEEGFFRGMVLDAYETELGRKWGALFSGLLFAIFHFNPQNFFGPLVLGIMFSYLVQMTGSIFAGVIAHATNNGIAVSMGFLVNLSSGDMDVISQSDQLFESTGTLLIVTVFYGILAIGFALLIRNLLRSLKQDYAAFEVGDRISVNEKAYEILEKIDEQLVIKEMVSEKLLTTDTVRLKNVGISSEYKLWDKRPLRLNILKMLPVLGAVIAYGYIIYLAYVKGVG